MSIRRRWEEMPFRKYLELLLLEYSGRPVQKGTYPYSRHKAGYKRFLLQKIEAFPSNPMKKLMQAYIRDLPRPTELCLSQTLLSAKQQSLPKHFDIMMDLESRDLIQTLGLLYMPSNFIWSGLNNIPYGLTNYICFADLEKYQYFFWNTFEKNNWGFSEKESFRKFLLNDPELTKLFQKTLDFGWEERSRSELVTIFNLPEAPGQSQSIDNNSFSLIQYRLNQALQNGEVDLAAKYSLMYQRMGKKGMEQNSNEKGGTSDSKRMLDEIKNGSVAVQGFRSAKD